jgi:hypothetical protein
MRLAALVKILSGPTPFLDHPCTALAFSLALRRFVKES